MKTFTRAFAYVFLSVILLVLLASMGSAFYAAFIQGGLLWRSTPFQLLIQVSPYLFGLLVAVGIFLSLLKVHKIK